MKKDTFKTVVYFTIFALLLALSAALFYIYLAPKAEKAEQTSGSPLPVIVIDAGHGGADGGAVGYDGTLEKELNLKIAMKLKAICEAAGYKVVMTRQDDVMLTTDDGGGSAKTRDLKKRLEISSDYPDSLTVSIHCNKFPDARCKGLQVYYSDSEAAENTAKSIQENVISLLQKDNHRTVKKADSAIYLLYRAKAPAVLVECGFLSNEEECSLLKDEDYQKKLALAIFSGIVGANKTEIQ